MDDFHNPRVQLNRFLNRVQQCSASVKIVHQNFYNLTIDGIVGKLIVLLQAWARLCKCLGQDFLPYMNVVMPPLLHSVQLKPDVTITSVDDSDDDIDKSDDEKLVHDCLGTLLKTFKTPFLPLFDELLPYLMPFWGKDRTSEEKRISICIFDDVAEHCGDVALKLMICQECSYYFPKIPHGLDPVSSMFKKHVAAEGTTLVKQAQDAASNKKAEKRL
uniref:Uncharacterized protein n=1 Tax=Lactuca sativa TaxID=4236 RepID=A0A9R1VBM6_LACSA|nr:hypothetical protein LSAT_V11C500246060 [Lactuca sativa]